MSAPLPDLSEEASLRAAMAAAAGALEAAGVASPRLDARLLLSEALAREQGCDPDPLASILGARDETLRPAVLQRFQGYVRRRCAREPVSRILGRREFWSLTVKVTPETLDPRPDSETVVEAVLAEITDRYAPLRLLDLGTGTGCLLLALLRELPQAVGLGIDVSADACAVARENAATLGLAQRAKFAQGDWQAGVAGPFNVIVTNPPYVPDGDFERLAPEIAGYEPRRALSGGADGLDCYRTLVPGLAGLLTSDGCAALEIGTEQSEAVIALLNQHGFAEAFIRRDLAGHPRCVLARL